MKHIRTLLPHELPKYRDHLLRLGPEDRRLRFGYPIADEGIEEFVDRLGTRNTRILVLHDPALQVTGAAHIAVQDGNSAELAFSVDEPYRGQGIGRDLLKRGLLWTGNRGIRRAHLYFLAENRSMRQLARDDGWQIGVEAGECEATKALPPPTPTSVFAEITYEAQAMAAYLRQANRGRLRGPVLLPLAPHAA